MLIGAATPSIPSADWPQWNRDDQRTGSNPAQHTISVRNVHALRLKWTQSIAGRVDWAPGFAPGQCGSCGEWTGVRATPLVANGRVYVADLGGVLWAFDEKTGKRLWTFIGHYWMPFAATPTIRNGIIYAPSHGRYKYYPGIMYALDAVTGALRWTYALPAPDGEIVNSAFGSFAAPLVTDEAVYLGTAINEEHEMTCRAALQIIGLNLGGEIQTALNLTAPGTTGSDVWQAMSRDPDGDIYAVTSNPCENKSEPFADSILRLSPTKPQMKIVWSYQAVADLPNDADFASAPLYARGMVLAFSKNGELYSVDAVSGQLVWKRRIGSGYSSLATDQKRLYIHVPQSDACADHAPHCGAVEALDFNGRTLWETETRLAANSWSGEEWDSPVVSNGVVFVSFDNGLAALDARDGKLLWRFQGAHDFQQGLAIVDGGLFAAEHGGNAVYCFTLDGK